MRVMHGYKENWDPFYKDIWMTTLLSVILMCCIAIVINKARKEIPVEQKEKFHPFASPRLSVIWCLDIHVSCSVMGSLLSAVI